MSDLIDRLNSALEGRYSIERKLGEGGMATVYLADDLKHDRKVALKVLKPELAAVVGAERFLAEIKTTASLQHPSILPLFDSGEADSFLFYVMPYVEGESLQARIKSGGQLPVDEAVRIATDVAEALDYAHRHGVIHRDIKPANILLQEGRPLVADFGIALAVSAAGGGRLTETGLSLGTPFYMSPEQATADRDPGPASDMYSLGCVLYEMLTGEPPYTGASAQAVLGKIITSEPARPTEYRKTIPPNVEGAIFRALEKLPADRFVAARDFAHALAEPTFRYGEPEVVAAAEEAPGSRWNGLSMGLAGVSVVLAVALGVTLTRSDPKPVARFVVSLPEDQSAWYAGGATPPTMALSPDGSMMVYSGFDLEQGIGGFSNAPFQLYVRAFDELVARPLISTERSFRPEISPDGERVAFASPQGIRVASLAGGPPITLVETGFREGGVWGSDGFIYFLENGGKSIARVSASGGSVEKVTEIVSPVGRFSHLRVLPGNRWALAVATPDDLSLLEGYQIHAVDLASGETRPLVTGTWPLLAGPEHMIYLTSDELLMGVRIDAGRLELVGQPVALIEGVAARFSGVGDVAVSESGTLVYVTPGTNAIEDVVWVTRDGRATPVDPDWGGSGEYEGLALSPDGTRLAAEIRTNTRLDIWVKHLDDGPISLLTFDGLNNSNPTWTPDGLHVSYSSQRDGRAAIWRKKADGTGTAELVFGFERDIVEGFWSDDGSWLVFAVEGPPSGDIYAIHPGVDSAATPLLVGTFNEFSPALSPDGRLLAYVSDESGRNEVYVRPFPDVDNGRWQISTEGGETPLWSGDGQELFYRHGRPLIWVADMSRGPGAADRRLLTELTEGGAYEANAGSRIWDVAKDGQRFVMSRNPDITDTAGDMVVVLNFIEELRNKVGR